MVDTEGSPTADVPAVYDESVDPHNEGRTVTGADAGDETVGTAPAVATPATEDAAVKRTLAGGTWVALIIGALLLILLLVFILQNQQQVELNLFAWSFQFPAGVGYLFSAIAGALIMALVGGVRMIELHRQVRRLRKQRG